MSMPAEYSFTRYLAAKKSIDDRSLNGHVWQALARAMPVPPPDKPLRVLEVGAGIGTMIERMMDHGLFSHAAYTAVDTQEQNMVHARQRLREWSARNGLRFEEALPGQWKLSGKGKRVDIHFRDEDIFDFAPGEQERWDLLIASAFLDLVDIPAALPLMLNMLNDGGIFYFTINFDGVTILEPAIDGEFDGTVLDLYHRSMDERIVDGKRSGESRTGRRLFSYLRSAGVQTLASGASDWVVFAGPDGYLGDEAYFLHFLINDMRRALIERPGVDVGRFEDWIAKRHLQIERGELVYVAHQLDFVGLRSSNLR